MQVKRKASKFLDYIIIISFSLIIAAIVGLALFTTNSIANFINSSLNPRDALMYGGMLIALWGGWMFMLQGFIDGVVKSTANIKQA